MTKYHYYQIINYKNYFNQFPSKEFVSTILEFVFNVKNWDTYQFFNKKDNLDVPFKMIELLPVLTEYLKPYIINKYFYERKLTFNNCLTLLHHFLLHYNYNLRFYTKIESQNFKYNIYSIYRLDDYLNDRYTIKIKKKVWLHFN